MGFGGQVVLALIIFFACLTTSIGLTTAISGYFAELSNNRMQYERLVFFVSAFSLVVANFGLETSSSSPFLLSACSIQLLSLW